MLPVVLYGNLVVGHPNQHWFLIADIFPALDRASRIRKRKLHAQPLKVEVDAIVQTKSGLVGG